MKIGSVILVVWLVIGALAAYQRNYFSSEPANCAQISTVLLTVVGPAQLLRGQPEGGLPVAAPALAVIGFRAARRSPVQSLRAPSAAVATNVAGGRKPAVA